MNGKLIGGIAAGALALTLIGGGVYAAETRVAAAQTQPTAQPPAQTPTPAAKGAHPKAHKAAAAVLIKSTADVTGLKPREVLAELRAGKTLAQIAEGRGKTADAVIQAARTKLQERLSKAVSAGKTTQEKADAALKKFDEGAPKLMQSTDLGKHSQKTR